MFLDTLENISRINFLFDIIQALVIAGCDDGVAHFLELSQIDDNQTAKERNTNLQGRHIDNHSRALGLDALHDALNGRLTEIVGI